jgi:hypothetical protein
MINDAVRYHHASLHNQGTGRADGKFTATIDSV